MPVPLRTESYATHDLRLAQEAASIERTSAEPARLDADREARVCALLKRHFGYDSLRPLQSEAIAAGLDLRDALVVLPTGGGKSLCYQMPPLVAERLDVVVSPLIALMKDQVDGLLACGYPAAALHSGMSDEERAAVRHGLEAGKYRLLFVSPERLASDGFIAALGRYRIANFAVDEAHCISQWGHDFRPEYRQLARLRDRFPEASIQAFTATATPRVRADIREQLRLRDAIELVGSFDRANLTYRVVPRVEPVAQTIEALRRHAGEAAIVYCLSRRETESMAEHLRDAGIRAACYHAGLPADVRHRTQEDFADEKLDVVVATVAFGMGIDRGDVRCVVHATMPKSIEHYQQETGRAGRDGLEAECVLLHSPADALRWERLMRRSADETECTDERERAAIETAFEAQLGLLRDMQRFCVSVACRHHALSAYFGQPGVGNPCAACDCCLGEVELLRDATQTARQILSAVARVGQRFGVRHVTDVLHGANTDLVRDCRHDALTVHGLMRERPPAVIRNLVHQLVDQGLLASTGGDRPVLTLTDASIPVLRGDVEVTLLRPRIKTKATRSAVAEAGWRGVDRELFDELRTLRRAVAQRIGKPPYVVFNDETLRELARTRPSTLDGFAAIRGVGQRKLRDYGDEFLAVIVAACRDRGLGCDMAPERERVR
ncbi:MAG: DNA helicase RecQ [Phycisphaerales bacterium]